MKGACVMLYQRIKTEYERLCNQIASVKHEMKDLPPGKLTCCHHKNSSKWYQSDGHQRIYIPKDNRLLAEQLARKKYLSKLLEDLENEKVALSFYLRHHSPSGKAEELLTSTIIPITEIAKVLGFSDTAQFSSFFRKRKGMTARDFRNKNFFRPTF